MAKVNAYNLTKQISKSANELLDDIMKSQEQVNSKIEKIKKIEIDLIKKQQANEALAASNALPESSVKPITAESAEKNKDTLDKQPASSKVKDSTQVQSEAKADDTIVKAAVKEQPVEQKPLETKPEIKQQTDAKPALDTTPEAGQRTFKPAAREDRPQGTATYRNQNTDQRPAYPRNNQNQQSGDYRNNQGTYNNQNNYNRNNNQQQGSYNRNDNQQGGFNRNNQQQGTYNNQNNFNRNNNQQQGTYNRNDNQQGGYNRSQGTYNNQNNFNRNNNQQGTYNRTNNQQGTYNRNDNQQGGYNRSQGTYNNQNNFNRNNNQQGTYNRTNNQQGSFNRNDNQQGGNRPGGFVKRDGQQGGFNRPNNYGPRNKAPQAPVLAPPVEKERVSNYDPNKSAYDSKRYDHEKKTASRKLILTKNQFNDDENSRHYKGRKKKPLEQKTYIEPIVIEKAIITGTTITIKEFSEKIGKPSSDIIKKLLLLGVMATINNEIDFDMATLIANDYGIELEQKIDKTYEEVMIGAYEESEDSALLTRPPVVTIMGHVDHGKTSLLDYIRRTSVVKSEAGGITQHIGAYTVDVNNKSITFLDTPGHEAFTSMRARGAQVTDIAILVVAADDGVMPQTIEAINHAKAAEVPIIVAITKIDRPNSNIDRIKQQLTEQSLVPEEWGGDTVVVELSSKTGEGIPQLLEMILLVAEVQELAADPSKPAKGAIIEAELDKGRGPVATVLVQNGTLRTGDTIIAGVAYGRVRAMIDDKGNRVDSAGPSVPVEVLGFSEVPEAGDTLYAVSEDKLSKQVAEERKDKIKADQLKAISKVSLDDLFTHISEGNMKELNIVIKADVQGSAEALKQSLEKLTNEDVRVRVIHSGVGAITKHDILLATASNGIIIGFNVRPDQSARASQDFDNVDIRTYRVIYNAIEDVEKAMKGLLDPVYKEVVLGHAEVRQTFKVSGVGTIAGCYVLDGKATNSSKVRVLRDGIVIHEGTIDTLKRFKDDAKEVNSGYECGIGLKNFNDVKEGDTYEFFIDEQVISE